MPIDEITINDERCACKGSFLDKLIQPSLLAILAKGPAHGFSMINELETKGLVSGDSVDPTGLYRTLKKMEAANMVTSQWDVESSTKPRKIYSITDTGRECLTTWKNTLEGYRENVSAILEQINTAL